MAFDRKLWHRPRLPWADRRYWAVLVPVLSLLTVSPIAKLQVAAEVQTVVFARTSVPTPSLVAFRAPVTTTTEPAPAPTTTTTLPMWTTGNNGPLSVAPGGGLPSDAECVNLVEPAKENRPTNASANRTTGNPGLATKGNWGSHPQAAQYLERVSGNYSGTTDELIQWASCKWGFDAETVRAQVMVESSWRQNALSGYLPESVGCSDESLRRIAPSTTTTSTLGATTSTAVPTTTTTAPSTESTTPIEEEPTTTTSAPAYECPTAFGLLQVRSDFHPGTYPMSAKSSAFNLDYSLAMKRACYEGVSWLGVQTRGDAWGCVGVHFSGKWRDAAALRYIERVQAAGVKKAWTQF